MTADLPRGGERSSRSRGARAGRHVGRSGTSTFSRTFSALGELAYAGAQVSANVADLATGEVLIAIDDRIVLPTASIGKVLLLIEISARMGDRSAGFGILEKTPLDDVGASGILQHLQVPALPLGDLATLAGAASDDLATNLLLREVGLDAVRARTDSLGLTRTALLDIVRTDRGPDDAPQFSVGSTAELSALMGSLARGEVVDATVSQRVMGWLSLNADLSLVASAFGLDPLAHRSPDHGILLINKTGTDAGVRAEVGVLRGSAAAASYAVTVQFGDEDLAARLRVLDAMRTVGEDVLEYVNQTRL